MTVDAIMKIIEDMGTSIRPVMSLLRVVRFLKPRLFQRPNL